METLLQRETGSRRKLFYGVRVGKIRNPKSEIRKKSEYRNPKGQESYSKALSGTKTVQKFGAAFPLTLDPSPLGRGKQQIKFHNISTVSPANATPKNSTTHHSTTKTVLMPSLSPRERAWVRGNTALVNRQCQPIPQLQYSNFGLRPAFGFRISGLGFPSVFTPTPTPKRSFYAE
jgi:hypothetical protein